MELGQSATRLEGNVVVGQADADEGDPGNAPPPPYGLSDGANLKDPVAAIAYAASRVCPEGFAAAEGCR